MRKYKNVYKYYSTMFGNLLTREKKRIWFRDPLIEY